MLKYRNHILAYVLVSVVPALLFGFLVWRLDVGISCSKWIWVPLVVMLAGAFGAELLGKWLRRRLTGIMPEDKLDFNLAVLVASMVSLGFNLSALILVHLTGNKLVATALILIGLVDAALSGRNIMSGKDKDKDGNEDKTGKTEER